MTISSASKLSSSSDPDTSEEAAEEVRRLNQLAQSQSLAHLRETQERRWQLFLVSSGLAPGKVAKQGFWWKLQTWFTPVKFKDEAMENQYQLWRAQNTAGLQASVHLLMFALLLSLWGAVFGTTATHQPILAAACVAEALLIMAAGYVLWKRPFSPFANTHVIAWLDTLNGVIIYASTLACVEGCFSPGCVAMPNGQYNIAHALIAFVFLLLHGVCLALQVCTMLSHIGLLYIVWFGMFIAKFGTPLSSVMGPLAFILLAAVVAVHTYQYNTSARLQFHMVVELCLKIGENKQHLQDVQEAHVVVMRERVAAERARTTREIHDAIMGYMCHQLRNPLHALRGILEQLRAACVIGHVVESSDLEFMDIAHASTTQLAKVSDDVLEFQRLQNGSSVQHLETVDTRFIINHSIDSVGARDVVEVLIAPEVPAAVQTDWTRVSQMLGIGLSNALKYHKPHSRIQLRCRVLATVDTTLMLQFEVWNEGEGLGTLDVRSLFDPYGKADSPHGDSASGARTPRLGLGLPISRLTAMLLGGKVGLSDRDRHTVYWFTLPLPAHHDTVSPAGVIIEPEIAVVATAPASAPPHVTLSIPASQVAMPLPYNRQGSGMADIVGRVTQEHPWTYWGQHFIAPEATTRSMLCMVVDDLKTNRRLLQAMLTKQGHRTIDLEDGDEILETLQEGAVVDVLLLDIHMVRTDGRDVARLLREQGYTFPIVAVTGNVSIADIRSYHQVGFDGVMGKPFTSKHLTELLEAAREPPICLDDDTSD